MTYLLSMLAVAQAIPEVAPEAAFELVAGSATSYGILGGVAAFLSVVVSVFAKFAPAIWDKLPAWARYLISFLFTGAGTGILAGLGGMAIPAAIGAGLTAGFAAIGFNQGKKVTKKVNPFGG